MISKRTSQRQKVDTKAATVLLVDDTGNFQRAVISTLGKEQKVMVLSPYGLCTNPSDNSLAIAMNINGIAANTVAIIDDPKNRKKNLAKDEVSLYNYVTKSVVYLKEDNSIELESASGAKAILTSSGDIELNGNADNVVAFADMKIAFDLLKTEMNTLVTAFNALVTLYSAHIHTSTMPGAPSDVSGPVNAPGVPGVPATADMSGAKVDTVKVP